MFHSVMWYHVGLGHFGRSTVGTREAIMYRFEEVISYIVEADSLDEAEVVMGEEYSSDFETRDP